MTINARIAQIRLHLKLTQKELADKTGISRPFLSQVESCKTQPSVHLLTKLVEGKQINAHWLLTGEGSMLQVEENAAPVSTETPALVQELQELKAIASQGRQDTIWRLLHILNAHPQGVTLGELSQAVVGVAPLLLLLQRQGLVTVEGMRYQLVKPAKHLRARELADIGAAIERGMLMLLEEVFPALERSSEAGVLQASLKVEDVTTWHKALRTTLLELLARFDTPNGQAVKVLVASTIDEPTQ